jgi:hypothetical protein
MRTNNLQIGAKTIIIEISERPMAISLDVGLLLESRARINAAIPRIATKYWKKKVDSVRKNHNRDSVFACI